MADTEQQNDENNQLVEESHRALIRAQELANALEILDVWSRDIRHKKRKIRKEMAEAMDKINYQEILTQTGTIYTRIRQPETYEVKAEDIKNDGWIGQKYRTDKKGTPNES